MATGFQCGITGLTDAIGAPAAAVVSPNLRVRTAAGYVATVADVVTFAGPSVMGNWLVPAMRCQADHIPVIHQGSVGMAYTIVLGVPTPNGPMQITAPDPRASGL